MNRTVKQNVSIHGNGSKIICRAVGNYAGGSQHFYGTFNLRISTVICDPVTSHIEVNVRVLRVDGTRDNLQRWRGNIVGIVGGNVDSIENDHRKSSCIGGDCVAVGIKIGDFEIKRVVGTIIGPDHG